MMPKSFIPNKDIEDDKIDSDDVEKGKEHDVEISIPYDYYAT